MIQGKENIYENQNERQGWRWHRRYPHHHLDSVSQSESRQAQFFKERKNSMKIKTNIKAGAGSNGDIFIGSTATLPPNHNQTMAKGLKVKSGVKAGDPPPSSDGTFTGSK